MCPSHNPPTLQTQLGVGATHPDEQPRNRRHDRQGKHKRDDPRRRSRLPAEGMVDLGQLPVAQRPLVARDRRGRVVRDLEVEQRRDEALRGAEGGDDDAGAQGLGGGEVLDGEVLLRL